MMSSLLSAEVESFFLGLPTWVSLSGLVAVLAFFCFVPDSTGRSLLYKLLQFLIFRYACYLHNVTFEGKFKLPEKGGFIVAANHTSGADPIYLGTSVPCKVSFLIAKEMRSIPYVWPLAAITGAIPVNRSGQDTSAIKTAIRLLKKRRCLGIFPEGKIRVDGLGRGKPGAAMIALKCGVPVIPIYLHGAPVSINMLEPIKIKTKVTIFVGEPFFAGKQAAPDAKVDRKQMVAATHKIMDEITKLRDLSFEKLGPTPPEAYGKHLIKEENKEQDEGPETQPQEPNPS
jgi:1-acyl-sn-glycerol-3-phosphate acyltransferase